VSSDALAKRLPILSGNKPSCDVGFLARIKGVTKTSGSFPEEFQDSGAGPDAARSLAPQLAVAVSTKAKITMMASSVINELHKHGISA